MPTADLDQQVLSSGQIDGKQYAIPTGVNAFSMLANPAALEKAKKELPDDSTWTWDQWAALAQEISATGAATGAEYNFNPAWLQIYAAQRGEKFYDGTKIGMSVDTLKSWWAIHQKLIETKGSPDAAKSEEIGDTGPEQSLLGTNEGAMGMWWSNQLNALTKSSGQDMTLLRMPKLEGATTSGMFLQPAMFYAASAKTEKADAAGKFIDFLVNDPDAAKHPAERPRPAHQLQGARRRQGQAAARRPEDPGLHRRGQERAEPDRGAAEGRAGDGGHPGARQRGGRVRQGHSGRRRGEVPGGGERRHRRLTSRRPAGGAPPPAAHRDSGREHLSTRYAFVGLGHRAQMYVDALLGDWQDTGTIVGLCDVNTTRMAYYAERIG
ncbi:extracellular solute-binding protein [Nonomuraea ferruginea]